MNDVLNFEQLGPGRFLLISQTRMHVQTDLMQTRLCKKVQVGKDQEKAQSEKDSHSKN